MRLVLVFAALCSTAVAAPIPKEVKQGGTLVGAWKLEKVVMDGRVAESSDSGILWVIDRNNDLSYHQTPPDDSPCPIAKPALPNGWVVTTVVEKRQMKFDPIRNEFDHLAGDSSRLGRYELRGDTLTVCLGFPETPRPTSVTDVEKTQIWTLKRVTK